ncbi:GDP-mannose 4,6-dehydratase [Tepidicaulis marinus]|jgi:GDPmannose 4,6-dehydratase|uniref:GDP-mannose 4,6-dehydratase n=1 Tax=Tepidicaulis marinus TaxID=1333998 RepID=A0A081BCJ0_9HYPH|nr:GDP-mannose 4,6-dehydratase [Tepidicaulis marinus]GAK45758.1 GDP-mannose 4,6-dehydratase [Tepidicaulis marinus]
MTKRKVALITGITGQDGGYLADLLLSKGYEVHGVRRRTSSFNTQRITHLYRGPHDRVADFHLHYADMTDGMSLFQVLRDVKPDEVYNLAAQSHVRISFDKPEYTSDVNGLGVVRLLEAIRLLGMGNDVRFYQASTSELFGNVQEVPQSETTPFRPRSPYAISKHFAFLTTANYREAYGFHASNGILFNHEGPFRGESFVSRKITRAAAAITHGQQEKLVLGNINATRDWGHARDYVDGMWRMLQQEEPGDYVLATGEQHSVREFAELAFEMVGTPIEWAGSGLDEKGLDKKSGKALIEIDPRFYRPAEVNSLVGNPAKARDELGWVHRTTFDQLVAEMVEADMKIAASGALSAG